MMTAKITILIPRNSLNSRRIEGFAKCDLGNPPFAVSHRANAFCPKHESLTEGLTVKFPPQGSMANGEAGRSVAAFIGVPLTEQSCRTIDT